MQAVFEYLDPCESRENFVLYNSHEANEDETRGQNRMLTTMQSFILALVRLRRNFHVYHQPYLFRVSEGTVTNTFTTWISFIYIYIYKFLFNLYLALFTGIQTKTFTFYEGKIS